MIWPFRRKRLQGDVARAHEELVNSKRRLEQTQREVVRPLRDMIRENHVGELLGELIQRSARRGTGDPGPARN